MNCLFWNVRGITAPGRKTLLLDYIGKIKPSIVGLKGTTKESFSDFFLKSLVSGRHFAQNLLPAIGSAGGILVGVGLDLYDVLNWTITKFNVSCTVRLKGKQLEFRIVIVYGSPYDEGKEKFLSELHTLFIDNETPTLVGGFQSGQI